MANLRAIGEIYIRITAMVATFSGCHMASKYILQHLLALILARFLAAMLCYIFVPITAMASITRSRLAHEWEKSRLLRKSKTLIFTVIEGILSGYVLSERQQQNTPPCMWFMPLGIAIATYTKCFNIGACHEKLLFVSVGLGTIIELVFGLIVGITSSYLCITAIYAAIGYFAIQFYVRKYRKEKKMAEFYEISYILANVYAQLLINYIFASGS